jgi:O-antigen ligase
MLTWVIPLTFSTIGWFTYDPVSLPQTSIFAILVFLILLTLKKSIDARNLVTGIALLLPVVYLASALLNKQSGAGFILGGYQRNYGFALYIGLALLFLLIVSRILSPRRFIEVSLTSTTAIAVIYGLLQALKLDFFPWANPFNSVTLTLGNPNFAGAFFGIMSACLLYWITQADKKLIKAFGLLAFGVLIFLGFKTNSIQFYLVLLVTCLTYYALNLQKNKSTIGISAGFVFAVGTLLIAIVSPLRTILIRETNFSQRLDYWQNGLQMWQDNPFFGVGIGNFQKFSALYRTPSQELRDGIFLIPDSPHNVLINHLATGGILAGIAWLIFVIYVTQAIFKVNSTTVDREKRIQLSVFSAIWVGYTVQSLISPDQIILTIIGYSAGGFIVYLKLEAQNQIRIRKPQKPPKMVFQRSVGVIGLASSLIVFGTQINADRQVKMILQEQITEPDRIVNAMNELQSSNPIERVGIKLFEKDTNCELIGKISDRMLELDDRSARAWYFKTICYNVANDAIKALAAINKSLEYDPINLAYLFEKAKIQAVLGDLESALESIAKVKEIDSSYPELEQLEFYVKTLKQDA